MTKKEEKNFQYLEDGTLKVKIQTQEELWLPGHNGNVLLGTQDQTTIHTVAKDKVHSLKAFIKTQREALEADIANKETDLKNLEFINEDNMDDKTLKELMDRIKSSKPFRKSIKALDNYTAQMLRKKQIKFTLNQKKEQLVLIKKDEVGINQGE